MIPQEYNRTAEELEQLFKQKAPLLIWRVERWRYGSKVPWFWTIHAEASILDRGFEAICTIDERVLKYHLDPKGLVEMKVREIAHAMAEFLLSDPEETEEADQDDRS